MGSDRARISYDEQRQYRAVIMQQGRVTVEADWNEAWQIANEERRKEILDIVGPCGTPDDGYRIVPPEQSSSPIDPYDFAVTKGTMYVGGLRTYLPQDVLYSDQSDWRDNSPFINSSPTTQPEREFIYLSLQEQEVSAIEDAALREVALGGPDTAQRLRLVQHFNRMETQAQDCKAALEEAVQHWASCGYTFAPHDMRLMPSGTLKVDFQNAVTTPDPCNPQATGSYLGADNQLIRIQISQADAKSNTYHLLWGYDNASSLHQITSVDGSNTTFKLAPLPIDNFHISRPGQTVEILHSAVQLDTDSPKSTNYMASPTGFVTTVKNYDATSGQVTLQDALSEELTNTKETPVLFLRVWQEELSFTLGTAVDLGNANSNTVTGLQVTIQVDEGETLAVGTYWQIAVRPNTPTEVYPHRYLEGPQPPDGPRIWVCPLGVIAWVYGQLEILADCRNHFDNLVELTKRKGSGCCDIIVRPEDITEQNSLQAIIDRLTDKAEATLCLQPGHYMLPSPLRIGPQHSNLTIEGCHDGVIIQAEEGQESNFLDGLIVLNRANNVTLRGLRFKLPLAPFRAIAEKLANMEIAEISRTVKALAERLFVSIGIRPLHCAQLTIKDCLFRYPSTLYRDVFGIGIFANSESWGLKVHNNRFLHEEDFTQGNTEKLRLLFGYMLTPTSIFQPMQEQKRETLSGKLVRSLLEDASFGENLFTNLSMAVLINADAGIVKFERNTVRDCNAGFWLLSLRSLAFTAFLDEVVVNKNQLAFAQRLRNSILAISLDPIIQVGSVLARSYPLPKEFDVSHAVQIAEHAISSTAEQEKQQIQALFNKALSFFNVEEKGAPTTEKVNIKEGMIGPSDTIATSDQEKTSISSEKAYTSDKKEVAAPSFFPSVAQTGSKELAVFIPLQFHLSSFERAALLQKESQHGLHLSLHISDNDIDATIDNVTSGIALVVWDDEQDTESMMIMEANKIRNRAQSAAGKRAIPIAAALVVMVERCAITGNLILNEAQQVSGRASLILTPGSTNKFPGVAVTSNVFQGITFLPARPNVPVPLNSWDFLNTIIP